MADSGDLAQPYLPIAEHGLVGDLHTVALVGTTGTIDWYCCPAFDAPSVFGCILDADDGGYYALRPVKDGWTSRQLYFPDTNILITRFFTEHGVGEVQDFMPIESADPTMHRHRLIRRVVQVRGEMEYMIEVQPRFDYGRAEHEVEMHPHGVLFRSPELTLALEGAIARAMGSPRRLERRGGGVYATFDLAAGQSQTFVLERVPRTTSPGPTRARDGRRVRRHRRLLAPLARPVRLPRPLARDGAAVGAHPEAADLRADRRAGRRADHVAARAARRRAQLGLPLHVDPRRRVLALRPAAARLHRGGGGLHGLADRPYARVEDRSLGPAPDHVRDRRPRGPAGDRASVLERLPRLRPGADRQRRRRPAPARHLRRADRLDLPLQQVRTPDPLTTRGRTSAGSSTGCARTGTRPTRASGRRAAARRTSRTRA